jgi:hypothetical protein
VRACVRSCVHVCVCVEENRGSRVRCTQTHTNTHTHTHTQENRQEGPEYDAVKRRRTCGVIAKAGGGSVGAMSPRGSVGAASPRFNSLGPTTEPHGVSPGPYSRTTPRQAGRVGGGGAMGGARTPLRGANKAFQDPPHTTPEPPVPSTQVCVSVV